MGLPQLMGRLQENHRMLRPVIHGHPRLWFVLIVVTLFATAPSITGNNDIIDGGGSNNVESYEEMPGDDLQGSRPSYATHSCNYY